MEYYDLNSEITQSVSFTPIYPPMNIWKIYCAWIAAFLLILIVFHSANHSSIYELFPYDLHIYIMHSEEVRQQFAKDQWANYQVAHRYNETRRARRISVMHAFLPILATIVLEFRIFSHEKFILSKML